MVLSQSRSLLAAAAAIAGLSAVGCQSAVAQSRAQPQLALSSEEPRPNRIQFEYVPPQNPKHEHVYKHVKEGLALEKVQQLFSPFRLPIDLTVKTIGCDGRSNAWYQRPAVSLCYEYLDEIWQSVPKEVAATCSNLTQSTLVSVATAHNPPLPAPGHVPGLADTASLPDLVLRRLCSLLLREGRLLAADGIRMLESIKLHSRSPIESSS